MKRRYRRSPVVEALVEFHFDEERPDPGVAGRYFQAMEEPRPRREQLLVQQIQFSVGVPSQARPTPPPIPTERLWFESPKSVIQVGPGTLSVHILEQPYPGSEVFRPRIKTALEQYSTLTSPRGFTHVAMRYLNRISIPNPGQGPDWMAVSVVGPPTFEGRISSVFTNLSVEVPNLKARLGYALRMSGGDAGGVEVSLDLGVVSAEPPSLAAVDDWLTGAHDEIVAAFEGTITDAARNAFEGY